MAGYVLWLALACFSIMVVYRVIRIGSMPLHLRWELYPLPLDPRYHYGGSYMEEVDFAKKTRRHQRMNGLREMAAEVLLLKRVREHNRHGLWPFSLAMHWGIYLLFGWVVLLATEVLGGLTGMSALSNAVGVLAWGLGTVGTLGLILKRATTPELAAYTAPVDYFHLIFLFAIFGTGLAGWLAEPVFAQAVRSFVRGTLPAGAEWAWLHVGLFALFLIYMPFSKLVHYIAKYFTIDKVLWDDAPNTRGSEIERRVMAQLSYKLTWSAPHIAPGQTWAQEVTITDAREVRP